MLGVGILGAGFFGAYHARAIAAVEGARLVAACAEELPLAETFTAEHGGKPYGDWRAMLDDKSVDAVAITAPHHLHCRLAVAALEAGKHVLLEKPMALSVAECTRIIASAEASRCKLMVGQIMHFVRPLLVAREILERGDLGKPVTGSSALLKTWMESNRRGWHLDPETGGGMLMTAGIHALDQLIWLMDGRVSSISAAAGNVVPRSKGRRQRHDAVALCRRPLWPGGKHRLPRWRRRVRHGARLRKWDAPDRPRSRRCHRAGRPVVRRRQFPRSAVDAERRYQGMAGDAGGHR